MTNRKLLNLLLCSQGENLWCKYNKGFVYGIPYTHNNVIPAAVMDAIKSVVAR